MPERVAPKLDSQTVIDQYKQGLESTRNQRERERAALKFMDPRYQWDKAHIAAREGTSVAGSPIPARPMLSISKIEQPIQLVQNGFQNSNLEVKVNPLSPGADKKTAEIFQGIIRQISRDSNAVLPRAWAFERATEAGFGCYRILTEYDPSSEEKTDQKIVIRRIRYQEAVIFDPAANEPDYSDGRYLFITSWMRFSDFRAQYPKAKIASADETIMSEMTRDRPEWVDVDNDQKGVMVSEYYKRVPAENGRYDVWWYKICAAPGDQIETLDSEYWEGQYIPVIPVIGKELQPFDRERRYQGIVEPAMDAQRGFNYAITTALEIAALEPKSPFVAAEGSFEGHEPKWNTINTRNWPYVEHKIVMAENGTIMPPPQRMPIDSGRLSVSLQLMQAFDQAIQAVTYTPDPALGKHSRDESGKAIEALQNQSVASTSNFMSNMTQISMILEGKILVDMIPRIYNNPGRIIQIVDDEEEMQEVMLNKPFVTDPNTGRPTDNVSVQPNQRPMEYNLSQGKYGVAVSVGKSYDSRFEQGREDMANLVAADPNLMGILGDIFFKYNAAPWSTEAEKRMKKVVEGAHPEFFKADQEGAETPEQLRAMLKAGQMQIQQLQQQLEMAAKAIETDQAKQQAALEKANIDAQTKLQTEKMGADAEAMLAEMDARVKIQIEEMRAESEMKIKTIQETAETERLEMQQRFDAMQSELDRQAEEQMARYKAEEAREMTERGHAHEAGMAAQNEGDE